MTNAKRNLPMLGLVLVLGGGLALLATGRLRWSGGKESDEEGHEAAAAEPEGGSRLVDGKVVLDEEELVASGIRTAPAVRGDVAATLAVPGEVRLADGRWARVTPRIPGVVQSLSAQVGDEVEAGVSLGSVESVDLGEAIASYLSELAEKALASRNAERWRKLRGAGFTADVGAGGTVGWVELDQALADDGAAVSELALAQKIHDRVKDLFAKDVKTQSDLWTAEQEVARSQIRADAARRRLVVLGVVADNEIARADLRLGAAEAKLHVLGLSEEEVSALKPEHSRAAKGVYVLKSPIGGVVLERNATVGQSLDASDAVFVVADLSVVWVQASLYVKDLPLVAEGMPARVSIQGYPDVVFRGRLTRVARTVDEKTRTVGLTIEVTNGCVPTAGGESCPLSPGMFVTVDVERSQEADAVVVPVGAVHRLGGKDVVFVKAPLPAAAGRGAAAVSFEARPVKTGTRDHGVVRILEGVKPGEEVAVENAFLVKSEFEKSKIGEED